nr:Ig-like and fibronectin type-III domain-containing protein 1 isoform X1 [Dermatophagoides farinae]
MTNIKPTIIILAIFCLISSPLSSSSLFTVAQAQRQNLPDLSDTSTSPIRVNVGDDIDIDCVIKNRNNLTVLWKYINGTSESLLAANQVIVSDDKRLSVIHHEQQERWILQIRFARVQDTGVYKCEVNSIPKTYETRMVMVSVRKTYVDNIRNMDHYNNNNHTDSSSSSSLSMQQPPSSTISIRGSYVPDEYRPTTSPALPPGSTAYNSSSPFVDRSFYECCQTEGVPILCKALCNLQAMISDQTKPFMYTLCYNYMAHIFRCISDGRNHLPCCQRQQVPQLCQPSCSGRYSLEKALDHAICHEHSKTILFCIADGLQVLPEQPQEIQAETINSTFILLKWTNRDNSLANQYKIIFHELHSFDENWSKINHTVTTNDEPEQTIIVPATITETSIGPLKRSTMYEIKMIATNNYGESLPTNDLRVVTHSSDAKISDSIKSIGNNTESNENDNNNNNNNGTVAPSLRRCCSQQGVRNEACLKQLCEPFIIEPVDVEESIMCMKYMNTSYRCIEEIRDNTDYEQCCEEEGVNGFCKHFCSGQTSLMYDFQSQFQCLPYMSSLISCVLERKGFVTTEPQTVSVSSVHNDWALVQWKPPKKRIETITKYQVHYRELSEDADDFYFVETADKSPFLIDKLRPSARYEVFVTAVNKHGVSRGSSRVLFNTTSPEIDPISEQLDQTDTSLGYNETLCCEKAAVQNTCLPLCNYHLKMRDLFKLSLFCAEPKTARTILRCLAGGRDHRPCCERRGIDSDCFDLCNGMITFTSRDVAAKCSKYDGKIFQCMAEGADTLPGMPQELHASNVTSTSISIAWNKSSDELPVNDQISFQIRYSPLSSNQTIPPHPFDDKYSTKLNVTNTRFTLTNLKPNTTHSIYVVSANQYGQSAPSQVLVVRTNPVNVTINTNVTHATIGPPHGLELIRKSITALVFRWSEPHYSSPDVTYSYDIFFQKVKNLNAGNLTWIVLHSNTNIIVIQNLTRNTQYAISVRARSSNGQVSPLSETLLAWTDPSLPLEISQPFVHPFPIIEGSMVTIRCESIGYPIPNMTVFINGLKVKTEKARIIHHSIDYVERNLSAIACQAVNEESRHPVQSFREVNVHFAPTITLYKESKIVQRYSMAILECEFSGYPKPKIRFLKDNLLISRFNNSRIFPHLKKTKTWVATFVIANVDKENQGNYDCIARNDYGEEKKTLKLLVDDQEHVSKNYTECCEKKNIPNECMFVCHKKEINLFDVYKNQKCLEHLNKYIYCAADGSDHRRCCMFREVATECLHWCAGYKIQKMDYCLVSSARDIMSCFREGNRFLPSPPRNVHVHSIYSNNHVLIEWEDSDKNRDSTHWYWVYWKKVGTNEMDRDRIEKNFYELTSLEPDSTYEFVIKTNNYHGTSIPSEPLVINLSRLQAEYLTSDSQILTNVMLTLLFFLLIFAAIALVYYGSSKNRFLSKFRSSNSSSLFGGRRSTNNGSNIGVSFENHAYNLEDTIQMQESTGTRPTQNGNHHQSNNNIVEPVNLFGSSDQNNNPNINNNNNGQPRVQIRLN